MRMVTAKRVAGNCNTRRYHATGNWQIMLLVTDTLFNGDFPMVHQGDSHISDNFKGKGIYFFVDIKLKD